MDRTSCPLEVFEADEKGDLDRAEPEEAGSSLRAPTLGIL